MIEEVKYFKAPIINVKSLSEVATHLIALGTELDAYRREYPPQGYNTRITGIFVENRDIVVHVTRYTSSD